MFAGLCFCVTHPIESVKTRVQVMSAVSETRGFIGAMVHILRTEGQFWARLHAYLSAILCNLHNLHALSPFTGMRPLCCGLKASAVRACLYSGIQFVTYEACRDVLLPDHFWIQTLQWISSFCSHFLCVPVLMVDRCFSMSTDEKRLLKKKLLKKKIVAYGYILCFRNSFHNRYALCLLELVWRVS